MKYYVVVTTGEITTKQKLKRWYFQNHPDSESSLTTHRMSFLLMKKGWKAEVVNDEFLLISPDSFRNGADTESEIGGVYNAQNDQNLQTFVPALANLELTKETLRNYILNFNSLKNLGIIRNQKDFTGQFGEWVASVLYEADIAVNGIQQDWDLHQGQIKYQVKSHAKATTTNAKWTSVPYDINAEINFLVIVIFNDSFKLERIYKVPFKDVLDLRNEGMILNWSLLRDFEENDIEEALRNKGLGFVMGGN